MARNRGNRPANLAAQELVYRAFAEILEAYNRTDGSMCDAAIETARKAIALDPVSSPAWTIVCFGFSLHLLHGRAADIEKVRAEAFAAGNKAVEADPLNPNAFMMRGLYQCNNAQFSAGLQDLTHALTLNPNDATLLYVLGYFQAMNGDAEEGMASIKRAIRLSPKDFWRPTMHQNLAFACAVGHRYAEGVEAALVARREMPSMAQGFTTLALNFVGMGEVDKARAVIDELREVAPQVLELRVNTGWACQRPDDAHRLKSFMRIAARLEEPATAKPALALPDKPSIAVLPFQNMSGDPEQEYFADGMTEDILTALSRFQNLFVIARNSSFTYKGRAVDIKQVARELGVRYVLEGSVRTAGGRIRVSAQLIEASMGAHVWADRYDRVVADLFDIQDELTAQIVSAIDFEVRSVEARRPERPTGGLEVWLRYHRALSLLFHFTAEANRTARAQFEELARTHPDFAPAAAGYGMACTSDVIYGWTADETASIKMALAATQHAVRLDDKDAFCHLALARVQLIAGDRDLALGSIDHAVARNPNSALAQLFFGMVLIALDRYAEALPRFELALRLSPREPGVWSFHMWKATCLSAIGEHDRALEAARQAVRERPEIPYTHITLASIAAAAGRGDDARAAAAAARATQPDLTLRTVRKSSRFFLSPRAENDTVAQLRQLGIPE
jgi:TolB-like protein/Tfp pilus assembly protein PilF